MRVSRAWTSAALAAASVCQTALSDDRKPEPIPSQPIVQAQAIEDAATIVTAAMPGTPATDQVDPLMKQLDMAIDITSRRYLTANEHSPWQIFHGLLALKKDFLLKQGDKKVNAIEWISTTDPTYQNEPWIEITKHGARFHRYTTDYAFEGHPSQSLALLAASGLPLEHQFKVSRHMKLKMANGNMVPIAPDKPRTVTIADIVANAKKEANTTEEMTWTLWAFTYYVPLDAQWMSQWNEPWSFERLVRTQVDLKVSNKVACGGNHNLFALALARDKYLQTGQPLRGVWLEADHKVKRYIEVARSLQNSDGSFSSNFYEAPGLSADFTERLNTTGHTLEFVARAVPDSRLNELWIRRAVAMLSRELIENRQKPTDCGPLYHSLDALIIYRDRVRPPAPQTPSEDKAPEIAVKPSSVTAPDSARPRLLPPIPGISEVPIED